MRVDNMDFRNSIEVNDIVKTVSVSRTANSNSHGNTIKKVILDHVSFNVLKGEVLGIIGRNGSGKSTLMKHLSSIMFPDSGTIDVSGKISSILELGMGLHPDLSGRENIYIKCSMFGLSKKETDKIIDEIIEFSELGDQIDDPVRTYSSGMNGRLSFSIAIKISSEIIIVDEVLSVGDIGFSSKCKLEFERLKKEGKTIVFVSHDLGLVEMLCDRVIWIEKGKIIEIGDAADVIYHYRDNLINSFDTVLSLATTGDVSAQYRLAIMYRDGQGVSPSIDKSIEWFTHAINLGHTNAMVALGDIYRNNGDIEQAKLLYQKASDLGNPDGTYCLMTIKNENKIVDNEVLDYLKYKAESGNVRAMWTYADALFRGTGFVKNQPLAVQWMEKAAKNGEVQAMFQLGVCYRDGLGVLKDQEMCEKWLSLAANNGHGFSKSVLADSFRKGITLNRDMKKAIYWYKEAALINDMNAMNQLGIIYRDGLGVEKNEVESEKWFSLFAKQMMIRLESTVADIAYREYCSEEERKKAVIFYEMSANGGFVTAYWQMGCMYRDGFLVEADSTKAAEYFEKAANCHHQGAMLELGSMYLRGNGVKKDVQKAFLLYQKAASYGNAEARYRLGLLYKDGIATEENLDEALRLFRLSSEYGNLGAMLLLDKCNRTNNHK